MSFAAIEFAILDDAVKPFLGRFAHQLVRQGQVFFPGETEAVNEPSHFLVRRLDAFRDGHLLFAIQQRDRPHLFEIETHRIIQHIKRGSVFFLLPIRRLAAVALGLVHDFHVEIAKLEINLIPGLGARRRTGQRVVDIAVRQIPLLPGQMHEGFDDFLEMRRKRG